MTSSKLAAHGFGAANSKVTLPPTAYVAANLLRRPVVRPTRFRPQEKCLAANLPSHAQFQPLQPKPFLRKDDLDDCNRC